MAATRPLDRCRVVVIDDNRDAAETMSLVLDVAGYAVRSEHDGLHGLATIYEYLPHVAVVDIGLPRLSGWDVAVRAREAFGPHIYLVAVSGWCQPEDVRRSTDSGFDRHFAKPVDPARMMEILREECARRFPKARVGG